MTPQEKADLRKKLGEKQLAPGDRNLAMNLQNRCRRANGSPRAWFATRKEAVAFEANLCIVQTLVLF
jgi:hypothetical protein